MKTACWLTLCISAILFVSSSFGEDKQKPNPVPRDEEAFAGKVLVIYCKEPAKGAVLEKVRVKQLGNRTFLVGKATFYGNEKSLWNGVTYWACIDYVTEIVEFNTLDDAIKAQAEAEQKTKDTPEGK